MWRLRDIFLVVSMVAGIGYMIYAHWLAEVLEPLPPQVWQLIGWTWFSWLVWHALQKISR